MATSVVDDADVALARAHAAEGEKYATYETTLAELYLTKAKEEQGHAHYAEAKMLAAEALKHATAATSKAAERRAIAPTLSAPTATVQHPVEVTAPKPATQPAPTQPTQTQPTQPTPTQPTPTPTQPAPAQPAKPKAPIDPGNPQ
jgi:hypothetical protein